jgi:hypothetical protein
VFLTLMVIGLVGLVVMAIPAFGQHGHLPPAAGHGGALGHGVHGGHALGSGHGGHGGQMSGPAQSTGKEIVPADASASSGVLRWIPSPRAVFSVFALYGAFGNALIEAAGLPFLPAALGAVIPALLVERLAVTPLWNLIFRFQGAPCAPLEELIFSEARAVTPFRNGRGIVSVLREGRLVQLSARLVADEAALPVKVGERLRVEDVDAAQERVTVSVLRDGESS